MPLVFGGLGIALPKTLGKIGSAQDAAASGCLLTRAIRALALRAPLASQSAPGGLVFWILFFGQAKSKSPGAILNSFSWPAGRKPWMGIVAVSRLSVREPTTHKRRDSDTKPSSDFTNKLQLYAIRIRFITVSINSPQVPRSLA